MTNRVYLIAGEVSGDYLGAQLLSHLRELEPELDIAGVGGTQMADQGLASLFPMEELSLMGFVEILPHLPRLIRRIYQTVDHIKAFDPDVVVTIDSPGFCLRVLKRLQGTRARRMHYVAPQAWAWRPGRAAKFKDLIDEMLLLFPFEQAFFETYGVNTRFVGHPITESWREPRDPQALASELGLNRADPILCLLPGSRRSEVDKHLPVIAETLAILRDEFPRLGCVLPTLPRLKDRVSDGTKSWPVPTAVFDDRNRRYDAYALCGAAIAASGTVGLELALAGLPPVIIYRGNPISAALARRLIRVPHVSLLNLILEREAFRELLQENLTPGVLARETALLLADGERSQRGRADLRQVVAALQGEGSDPPSLHAARRVLANIELVPRPSA
ncbi:MAG: lipid-A-disaccharide synthase [Geminicoccaceae bacterium]